MCMNYVKFRAQKVPPNLDSIPIDHFNHNFMQLIEVFFHNKNENDFIRLHILREKNVCFLTHFSNVDESVPNKVNN